MISQVSNFFQEDFLTVLQWMLKSNGLAIATTQLADGLQRLPFLAVCAIIIH